VLAKFDAHACDTVGTMGVCARNARVLLLFSTLFVNELPYDQLGGVLLHEVHHVIFGHIYANPAEFPDRRARIIAEEVTVNEFVTEPLPKGAILLADIPDLPPLESTRKRYQRLESVNEHYQPQSGLAVGGLPDIHTGDGGYGDASAENIPSTIDDHSVWPKDASGRLEAHQAARQAVEQALLDVGPEAVPPELRSALHQLGIGRLSGRRQEFIKTTPGRVDWRHRLRRLIGRGLQQRPDFLTPSRRLPQLVGIVPGRRRRTSYPCVQAVIDTSGSITPKLLGSISGELGRLAREHHVTVVECDAAVHAVYPYRSIASVRGRGGTDLRPPLEPAFLNRHRPDVVIYFTDGYGPAPKDPPRVPVIWCIVPGGKAPVPWGRVIKMEGVYR
jgi:predicted metal-dependent peptidase